MDDAPNAFAGRATEPTDAELKKALGRLKPVWDGLIGDLAAEFAVAGREWKCYSAKTGWALRMFRGKRTIAWMAPCAGCFRVSFILGDRALVAARECGLSAAGVRALDEAPRYAEGTGVRLVIRGPQDLATVKKLAVVKIEN
jgi:hypothetical protein